MTYRIFQWYRFVADKKPVVRLCSNGETLSQVTVAGSGNARSLPADVAKAIPAGRKRLAPKASTYDVSVQPPKLARTTMLP